MPVNDADIYACSAENRAQPSERKVLHVVSYINILIWKFSSDFSKYIPISEFSSDFSKYIPISEYFLAQLMLCAVMGIFLIRENAAVQKRL